MRKLFLEYKSSLKDSAVEEVVDLALFRPIAFLFVKFLYLLPITPNQISVLSMVAGVTSGVLYARGDKTSFVYAGLFYALSHILDCCDGMIARLKKNGSPMGRIIDGWADYVTSISVYIGFWIGLSKGVFELPAPVWLLVVPAGISMIFHCMKVDYYRHEFMAHALGKTNPVNQELEFFTNHLENLKKQNGKRLEKVLITFFLGYTRLQSQKIDKTKKYNQQQYYKSNRILLLMWNWIGLSTHVFTFVLASLLFEPMLLFYYSLGAANILMLVVEFIQVRTNKKIAL
ncbi:MAG: CDP-alcohol phosphatidyltransferase family protein [bacterium]|nr:CDP-alcohol phosphatidyltransferase family protein [bacterium]